MKTRKGGGRGKDTTSFHFRPVNHAAAVAAVVVVVVVVIVVADRL